MSTPPAGWYRNPDPGVGGNRYWDGSAWSITDAEYAAQGQAPAATPAAATAGPPDRAVWTASDSGTLSTDQMAKRKALNKRILIGAGSVLAAFILVGAIASMSGSNEPGNERTASDVARSPTAEASSTEDEPVDAPPSAPVKPAKPIDVLAEAVKDSDAKSPTVKQLGPKDAQVTFKVSDNFTNGMIRTGIVIDSFDVARRVSEAETPYKFLTLVGTFPLIDKYGNESDGQVFKVTFELSEIRKINWDNFVPTEIEDVEAFSTTGLVFLFPDLRE